MARILLNVVDCSYPGAVIPETAWVASDSTDGHKFLNDGRTTLLVRNGTADGVTINVDVLSAYQRDGLDLDSLVMPVIVPAAPNNEVLQPSGFLRPETFSIRSGTDKDHVYVDVAADTLELVAVKF